MPKKTKKNKTRNNTLKNKKLTDLVKHLSTFNVSIQNKGTKTAVLSQKYNHNSLHDISNVLNILAPLKKGLKAKTKTSKKPIKRIAKKTKKITKQIMKKNDIYQKKKLARDSIFNKSKKGKVKAKPSPKFKFTRLI